MASAKASHRATKGCLHMYVYAYRNSTVPKTHPYTLESIPVGSLSRGALPLSQRSSRISRHRTLSVSQKWSVGAGVRVQRETKSLILPISASLSPKGFPLSIVSIMLNTSLRSRIAAPIFSKIFARCNAEFGVDQSVSWKHCDAACTALSTSFPEACANSANGFCT